MSTKVREEELLSLFLKKLDENVFVKSTDSVSGEEEQLNPVIEDMEAVIAISGEWDREDLKGILTELFSAQREELARQHRIEKKQLIRKIITDIWFLPRWSRLNKKDKGVVDAIFENDVKNYAAKMNVTDLPRSLAAREKITAAAIIRGSNLK